MPRIAIALILGLHGLVHLVGFVSAWQLADLPGFPYTTLGAWGRVDLGDRGARRVGLAWLLAALLFVVGALAVWAQLPWAGALVGCAAALSLVLCVLGSPATTAGITIDVIILLEVLYRHGLGSPPSGLG